MHFVVKVTGELFVSISFSVLKVIQTVPKVTQIVKRMIEKRETRKFLSCVAMWKPLCSKPSDRVQIELRFEFFWLSEICTAAKWFIYFMSKITRELIWFKCYFFSDQKVIQTVPKVTQLVRRMIERRDKRKFLPCVAMKEHFCSKPLWQSTNWLPIWVFLVIRNMCSLKAVY